MIMDPPPTPKVVGLEFVRQYYTVLNKAPAHLHRFYNNDSSFVHGGPDTATREEPAVFGQVEIHRKIVELDFRDCHAKIRQVDSHATLGSGVVIQDEVFSDDDPTEDGIMDDDEEGTFSDTMPMQRNVPNAVSNMNGVQGPEEPIVTPVSAPATHLSVESTVVQSYPEEPVNVGASVEIAPQTDLDTSSTGYVKEDAIDTSVSEEIDMDQKNDDEVMPNASEEKENKAVVHSPEPRTVKTFATLFKTTSLPPTPISTISMTAPPNPRVDETCSSGSTSNHAGSTSPPNNNVILNGSQENSRYPKNPSTRGSYNGTRTSTVLRERTRLVDDAGPMKVDDRRRSGAIYSDSQQIFVGNIPQSVTDQDLRECFSKYGKVLEVRLLPPTGGPNRSWTGDRPYPSFGFVVFDCPETVQDLLLKAAKDPITYHDHRLNVEEKKARSYSLRSSVVSSSDGHGGRYSDSGRGRGGRGGLGVERGRGSHRGGFRGSGQPRNPPSNAGSGSGTPGSSYRR
ncbi:unnamed protein product [Notodromas monacha]|uniref:Uncharacterized protein n=1 Tax=Notodromas monacha TaxID=399045 RepID=A0A7R9BEA1_9CRUS|nr:unnamed protein product [Notodromas monacha]CAG0913764.1 unnamed protein product [Notodromas monacha]